MLVNDCVAAVGEVNVKVVGLRTSPFDVFGGLTAEIVRLPALLVTGTVALLLVVALGAVGSPTLLPPPLLQAVTNDKTTAAVNARTLRSSITTFSPANKC
ncbi:MAG: hypothetical protein NVSMB64_25490 [Candidatus Velthaea sp.]